MLVSAGRVCQCNIHGNRNLSTMRRIRLGSFPILYDAEALVGDGLVIVSSAGP